MVGFQNAEKSKKGLQKLETGEKALRRFEKGSTIQVKEKIVFGQGFAYTMPAHYGKVEKNMLFDSHAHIGDERFDSDRTELMERMEKEGLSYVMDVGCDLESSQKAVENAACYPICYAAVGIHPHYAESLDDELLATIRELAAKPKVVAIGEIGLDYHYDYSERDIQQDCFRRQIRLALELKKPIIIHDRESNDDVMRILKEEGVFAKARTDCFAPQKSGLPDARLLLHCFSGSRELAEQYVKLGATLSIAGPVTFKNARKAVEVVEHISLEHLLVETDSPYLTPEPFRGKRNEPLLALHTARKIADIKGLEYQEVLAATCANAKAFFSID